MLTFQLIKKKRNITETSVDLKSIEMVSKSMPQNVTAYSKNQFTLNF